MFTLQNISMDNIPVSHHYDNIERVSTKWSASMIIWSQPDTRHNEIGNFEEIEGSSANKEITFKFANWSIFRHTRVRFYEMQGVAKLKLSWFYSCVCMSCIGWICNLVCWTLILNWRTHKLRHHFPKMKENLVTDRKPRI